MTGRWTARRRHRLALAGGPAAAAPGLRVRLVGRQPPAGRPGSHRRDAVGQRSAGSRSTERVGDLPDGLDTPSARTARPCPPVSGRGSRWRGCCSRTGRGCCSTSPSAHLDDADRAGRSWRPSGSSAAPAVSSSWRTGRRWSPRPTRLSGCRRSGIHRRRACPPTCRPHSRPRRRPSTTSRHPRAGLALSTLLGGLSSAAGVALTATAGWLIVQASYQPAVLTLLVAIVGRAHVRPRPAGAAVRRAAALPRRRPAAARDAAGSTCTTPSCRSRRAHSAAAAATC